MLLELKAIEKRLGRNFKAKKWAPRTIDLDILSYNNQIISQDNLTIPHKEFFNRPFLMLQMAMLQPNWKTPDKNSKFYNLSLSEIIHKKTPHNAGILKGFSPSPQIVGIINITPDSFSDGGKYFNLEKAFSQIETLSRDGASIIDIGAQSTKQGAVPLTAKQEWQRLKPLLELLSLNFSKKRIRPQISLDSFYPEIFQKAFSIYPLDWINNIKATFSKDLIKLILQNKSKIVLTHTLGIPPTKEKILPFDTPPMENVLNWAKREIQRLESFGISKEHIIIDPGIGFGKSKFQSMQLLQNICQLKTLGCEILVGHSRKLKLVSLETAENRDLETLGISHMLQEQSLDYIRVHNVDMHHKFLTAKILAQQGIYY